MFDWNGWSSLSCQCDSFETTKSMPVYMTNSHQFYILLVGYIPTVEVCWIQFLKVVKLIDLHHLCTRDASNVAPSAVFEKVSRLLQEPRKAGLRVVAKNPAACRDDLWLWHVIWLVVATPLKNMKVNEKDYPIYYGNIKFMLQTTKQSLLTNHH